MARWLAVTGIILAAAGGGSGCSAEAGQPTVPAEPKPVAQADADGIEERTLLLSDGRTVTCLTWDEYDTWSKAAYSGMSCDWANSEGTK